MNKHFLFVPAVLGAMLASRAVAQPIPVPDLSVQGGSGWNVTAGSVDVAGWGGYGFFPPVVDTVVDLDGYSVGQYSVDVTLPTTGDLTVNWYLGANYAGPPNPKLMDVILDTGGAGQQTSSEYSQVQSPSAWNYESYTFDDVGAGVHELSFTSLDGPLGSSSYYGPVISDVSASEGPVVQGVPDAASTFTLAALALGGLILAAARRRSAVWI